LPKVANRTRKWIMVVRKVASMTVSGGGGGAGAAAAVAIAVVAIVSSSDRRATSFKVKLTVRKKHQSAIHTAP
jgi:hypothetical protein